MAEQKFVGIKLTNAFGREWLNRILLVTDNCLLVTDNCLWERMAEQNFVGQLVTMKDIML